MKQTDNLGLALYEATDKFSITGEQNSLNANTKIIDKVITEKIQKVADAASEVTGFKTEIANEIAETSAAQKETRAALGELSDNIGGLTFSITEAGLLHIGLKQTAESTVESTSTEV